MAAQEENKPFLYKVESRSILQAAFTVYNTLGNGFFERVYENAMLIELEHLNIEAKNQIPIPVYYRNQKAGDYIADIIVENKIIIEIKSGRSLEPIHKAQLLNDLKATQINVGFLLNFGYKDKLQYKRFIY